MEAIRRTRLALQGRVPLIGSKTWCFFFRSFSVLLLGFAGAPFTLMAYAVEV